MTDRELMQQALNALEEYVGVVVSVNDPNDWTPKVADAGEPARKAIEALRARLAQEPLTFEASNMTGIYTTQPYAAQAAMVAQQTQGRMYVDPVTGDVGIGTVKSQREWQGMTENEIKHLWYEACQTNLELTSQLIVHLARNIEAKLKEKNT